MGDMAGETAEPARCNCLICGGDDANATCINQLDAFSVDARQNAPACVDDLAIPAFLRRY
jgi:hypothetical protein